MTRYDIAKFYGYNSPEEYDEAEKRKHEIFTESLKKQKPYVEKEPVKIQPVNQWISVKDRLPEENILVLCYARSTTGEGHGYFLGALAHGEFWFLKVNDIGHVSCPVLHWEVTHWQPLPESPKEADDENVY
ncbi:MAG: DUF551 domain-containing protein [Ruminococcus sp.]|nr:DUF551 domain-containing protein [Ruminococcus sp.]